jgi:hypothetical protein
MKRISYKEVPRGYAHCVSSTCPLSETCLRAIAWRSLPKKKIIVPVVNPACTAESEACEYFRTCAPSTLALGFTRMQSLMLPKQYEAFSALLKAHFGRNPYFQRRNGQRPILPEEQELIRQTLAQVGARTNLKFDAYKEEMIW